MAIEKYNLRTIANVNMINKFTTNIIITCQRQWLYGDISRWYKTYKYSRSYSQNISMWQNKRIEKHAYLDILDDFTYSMIILSIKKLSHKQDTKRWSIKMHLSKYGTCLSTMPPRNKIINNINSRWHYLTCSHFLGL